MEMSSINQQNIASVQQALSTAVLEQSMNRSAATVSRLFKAMAEIQTENSEPVNRADGQGSQGVRVDFRV